MTEEKREIESPEDPAGEGQFSATGGVEVEALHAELAQLQGQVDEYQVAEKARQHRGRGWAVGLLVVLGCLLLAGANVTFWLRAVVLDSDTWAATVGPLTQNETVANALSILVVEGVFDLVDVEQAVGEALPPDYAFLSGGLTRVLQDVAQDAVTSVVQSDQFNAVWVGVNRTVHRGIMGVLRGDGNLLYLSDGKLTVDLSDAFGFVVDTLRLGDLALLEGVQTRFVLLESQQVAAVQRVLALIDGVGLLLPLLALGALVLAWVISLWRRRTVMWIGIGVAIAMAVSLIVFFVVQPIVLVYIADPFVRLLAGEIMDVIIRGLYVQTAVILVLGLLLWAGAALAGPGQRAVAIRTGVRRGWDRLVKREEQPA
jgi:hypothetical protein